MTAAHDDVQPGSDLGTPRAGMPRWVKVFLAVVLAALVVLLIVMMLVGGQHGPGRHMSSSPSVITAVQPVVGSGPASATSRHC